MPMHRSLNHDFFETWSPEMAYVLGFFAADGTIVKNSRGGCYLEFHITDRQILLDIRKVLDSNHKISERVGKKENHKKLYRLQIGSKKIFSDIVKLGFTPCKTKTMKFPKVPQRYLSSFIRGYFDGDGGVYFKELYRRDRDVKYKYLMAGFTCGNREFLDSLYDLLKTRGVSGGSLVQKKGGWELKFSRVDSLALYRLMYNNGEHCSIFLKRKKRKFEQAIKSLDNAVVV